VLCNILGARVHSTCCAVCSFVSTCSVLSLSLHSALGLTFLLFSKFLCNILLPLSLRSGDNIPTCGHSRLLITGKHILVNCTLLLLLLLLLIAEDDTCVDYMSSTVDLSGIEVVDADRRFIRQARKDVELQAHKMLEQGIEAQV